MYSPATGTRGSGRHWSPPKAAGAALPRNVWCSAHSKPASPDGDGAAGLGAGLARVSTLASTAPEPRPTRDPSRGRWIVSPKCSLADHGGTRPYLQLDLDCLGPQVDSTVISFQLHGYGVPA